MSNLGGISRGDEHIYVKHLPGHKRPVLCIGNGCVIKKLASFDNDECAESFYKLLLKWVGLREEIETK